MTTLIVGATGKTGRFVVEQLLRKNHEVRIVVRSTENFPREVLENPNTTVVEASVLDLTDGELAEHVRGCDAVVSCLGHVLSFKGMFGDPRKLCTDATRRLCGAIEANDAGKPTKFILMNTVGVSNPDRDQKRSGSERALLTFLRYAIPPHRDNETAAAYLHAKVGMENRHVQWCSVRPDSLIDADVSPYDIAESPTTGIFSGRPTTRANVAHFMVELIERADLWDTWTFKMPVVMNSQSTGHSE
ncbi:MAG: nucleoside-diphosphate-sugar epimerase [Candidatus Binatia bacterium]|jgi:nucleoside-diphosphate-sugar epimerase